MQRTLPFFRPTAIAHLPHALLTAVTLLLASSVSHAEKFAMELYASRFDSIPIAILPFKPAEFSSLTKDEPWKIIADDLEFLGRFTVTRATRIDSSLVVDKNIGIYIDGEYRTSGKKVVLDCGLRDATTGDLLMGKKYEGDVTTLRSMAHQYSNAVVEAVLGEQGIFETKMVFVRDKGAVKELGLMDYDGGNMRTITTTGVINLFPTFADPTTVLLTSYLRGKPDIFKLSLATGKPEIFSYSRMITTSPSVSPVDGTVAYASSREGNMEIYTCGLDKTNVKRVTVSRSIDTSPAWSPGGIQIAFCSDRAGNPQIYVVDRDGSNAKRITFEGSWQDSPEWSPKGDKIAYQSMQGGKFDIWTVAPDGANATAVTTLPGNNEYPTWSPDGSHIAFVNSRGGRNDIYAIRPDGTGLRQMTKVGNAKMPSWGR